MARTRLQLEGKKFGRWTVIEIARFGNHGQVFWKCKCDCGKEGIVSGSKLNKGYSKSCGCYQIEKAKILFTMPNGEASLNALYASYKAGAIRRKIEFALDKEDFRILTQQSCFYCGSLPFQENKAGTIPYKYMGVDRIDNSRGYLLDNCVPCCKICNAAKSQMSLDEFLVWMSKVYNNFVVPSKIKVEYNAKS